MELKDTVAAMESEDYKGRFIAEAAQIIIRLEKLGQMISKYGNGELDFTPKCPLTLLICQRDAMLTYLDMLILRANYEGVSLESLFNQPEEASE